jgi:hypothetical protein
MTTLVTADEKGRLCIRGTEKGQKYLVKQGEGGWWVAPVPEVQPPRPASTNRRDWPGRKDGRTLWKHIERMGKLGLRIEESESGKQPVPPCRF